MLRQQWVPVRWGTACAIFLWEHRGTLFISSENFGVDENNALHSFAHADGHYHLMGCMLSAASCNKWWMDEITEDERITQEEQAKMQPGSEKIRCILSALSDGRALPA